MCSLLEDQKLVRHGCSSQKAEKYREGKVDALAKTMINIASAMTNTRLRLSGRRAGGNLGF